MGYAEKLPGDVELQVLNDATRFHDTRRIEGRLLAGTGRLRVRSDGFELEISGAPLRGWQISGGYTYFSAEYRKDSDATNIGQPFAPTLPRRMFKLFTSYQLPGALAAWNIGGSMYVQSESASPSSNIRQGGYTLVNLLAGVRLNDKFKASLNLNNVFDKVYYDGIGWIDGGNRYGKPRNAQLQIRYDF